MGCVISSSRDAGGLKRRPKRIGEVAVFVPGFRFPKTVDFSQLLADGLPKNLTERLSVLRARVVLMALQEAPVVTKARRKAATRHGNSMFSDLRRALEDYLPNLLGLLEDGNNLKDRVRFVWVNQEDNVAETAMSNPWYEVLSVLHLMAILCLSEANFLLLPKTSSGSHQPRISEESRRSSIDVFLMAAGYLDCAIRHVLPRIPLELRSELPLDLTEGVLRALCMQALGQGVDVQLWMAIDSPKATLAVKRRLACEMVKYWHQAQDSIPQLPYIDGWWEKHRLYVKWKYAEAKASAYYYHGLIVNEGTTNKSREMSVASLQAAEEFLNESKKVCEAFHASPPKSRNPPPWGSMKYISEKIPKDACSKVHINRDLYSHERILEAPPPLPDFALSLKPDDYQLPPVDPSWSR